MITENEKVLVLVAAPSVIETGIHDLFKSHDVKLDHKIACRKRLKSVRERHLLKMNN